MIEPRIYRERLSKGRFYSFTIGYKDSDIWIGVDFLSYRESIPEFAQQQLVSLRKELEEYILLQPEFASSFSPIDLLLNAPEIAVEMAKAGKIAGTGPMAAVAGAFSEFIGKAIQNEFSVKEIIVENGGDIYLVVQNDLIMSVFAGKSELSEKIGVEIKAHDTPIGICTSAGTVGPSISFGKADAVMVACKNTALADAFASAIGNCIQCSSDIDPTLHKFKTQSEVLFTLAICEGKIGLQGIFNICPIKK